ncbi:MAG: methylated-DNA--[protein]-cysteine S-methyltransferase [Dehalococcoidales bacterium]|nr:methylated-DNA--[protein]-cysteine S-methyltransferase [Dehalococcoidales bacterium]
MAEGLNGTIFNTRMGWMGILGSARGLLSIILPQSSRQQARELLGNRVRYTPVPPHLFDDLVERLKGYLSGSRVDFPDRLDLSGATPFQRTVWETTRFIPYGETRSYIWVAGQINQPGAARAVGQALGSNPLPIIIPCHRVLRNNGSPGGFSSGIEIKERLLQLENPTFTFLNHSLFRKVASYSSISPSAAKLK